AISVNAQDRAVVDLVPQVLDSMRVLADQRGREGVVAERRDGAEIEGGTAERAGAVARDPLVRRQLDEGRLTAQLVARAAPDTMLLRDHRVDDVRLDAGDPHPSTVR